MIFWLRCCPNSPRVDYIFVLFPPPTIDVQRTADDSTHSQLAGDDVLDLRVDKVVKVAKGQVRHAAAHSHRHQQSHCKLKAE